MEVRGAEQTNLSIISMGVIGDYIVVFTTNADNNDPEPNGTYGQIWKFVYDKVTDTIASGYLDGNGFLTLDESLVVNRVLDFSMANKVHFEGYIKNDTTIKIYLYDGYNILRHINIVDSNVMGIPESAMDILANVEFSYPVPIEIIESGSLKSGQYRYSYQMYNVDGNQTTYSPTSIGISMYPGDYYDTNDMNVIGGAIEESCSKSLKLSVTGLDLTYERVRIVSILYPNNTGIPEITIIKDTAIPEDGTIIFVDDGTTTFGAVTIQEFRTLGTELFVPATAEVKENMLICGGIIEKRFELDDSVWDARAYRFGSNQTTTNIQSISEVATQVDSGSVDPNWDILLTHDCIQNYDQQDTIKYQVSSTTLLGGEGPNIKYEFIMGPELTLQDEIIRGQTSIDTISTPSEPTQQYNVPKQVKFKSISANNTIYDFNGVQYTNFSYDNYASPIISGLFTGYAKNEMYRFGIEFFNKKGKRCFVKWISDIRFPDFGDNVVNDWEENSINYSLTNSTHNTPQYPNDGTNGSPTDPTFYNDIPWKDDDEGWNINTEGQDKFDPIKTRPLGIKFTLKTVPVDEDGDPYDYRIVRAERTEQDKRMVMQGPMMDIQNPIQTEGFYRPLTLNTFSRVTRVIQIPHYLKDPDIGIPDDQYYRFGNYCGLLGWSAWEAITPGGAPDGQDVFSNGTRIKWIKQLYEHMFISPEIYFTANYVVPNSMDFAPIGIAHIQERDVVDSYMIPGDFYHDGDIDGPENYIMITGAPQFYWGPDHLNNMLGNVIELSDAVIVPSPAPDFNLGTAVYSIETNTGTGSFIYRNVVNTKQPAEDNDPKESIRAGKRLILSLKNYFPGYLEDDIVAPDYQNNRNLRLVDSHSRDTNNYNYQLLTSYIIGRMQRTLANQYGGNSYYDRTQTTYIPAGPIIKGTVLNTPTFEGDIYINVFDYLNLQFSGRSDGDQGAGVMETHWMILESTINVDLHSAISYNDSVNLGTSITQDGNTSNSDFRGNYNIQEQGGGVYGIPNVAGGQYIQNYNLTDYNTSYISDNRAVLSVPTPLNYDPNIYFYARIHRSQDKVYNDIYDRWLIFLPDNYKDVNTAYGKITNLQEYANKLYFYQEKAIGILGINEMALEQTDQAGATLLLGKADVMNQYIYVDNNHGVTIPNSVYTVPQGIIGFDSENLKLFMIGGQGVNELSVQRGIQGLIKKSATYSTLNFQGAYDSYNNRAYNVLYGIGWDFQAPAILAELPQQRVELKTNISYNTALGVFESVYDFTPDSLVMYKGELITTNPNNKEGWLHGSGIRCNYYGTQHSWWVTPVVNRDAIMNSLLTNFEVNINTEIAPNAISIRLFPDSNNIVGTQFTFKKRLNTWRCEAPRLSIDGVSRIRAHTFAVQLVGGHTERVVTHSILSYTMPNPQ